MKGITKSGFEYTVADDLADDYELLEKLREANKNELAYIDVIEYALGSEQNAKLKEHCRKDGKVSAKRMNSEFLEILTANRETKK